MTSKQRYIFVFIVFLTLFLVPLVLDSVKFLNLSARILIFLVLVASYDLMLGFLGMISFAHTMFFGIGAYGIILAIDKQGVSFTSMALGAGLALLLSFILSLILTLVSLRVKKSMYFAMISLSLAYAFQSLVIKFSEFTGGEDGVSVKLPGFLAKSFEYGFLTGNLTSYWLIWVISLVIIVLMLRFNQSSVALVVKSLKSNESRFEALGFSPLKYKMGIAIVSSLLATVAGMMLAIWYRYTGIEASLSFEIMIDILLILTIGGMGNIYGAFLGTLIFLLLQYYLQDLLGFFYKSSELTILSPDRWLLWLGLLFIAFVYFFPKGIVKR